MHVNLQLSQAPCLNIFELIIITWRRFKKVKDHAYVESNAELKLVIATQHLLTEKLHMTAEENSDTTC